MLNQERARSAVMVLNNCIDLTRLESLPVGTASDFNQVVAVIYAIANGDSIADLWSLEDVDSLEPDCQVEQLSEVGEDDGLTWYHCGVHDQDTLMDNMCEDCPQPIDKDTARKVLQMAVNCHDAEQGINWDVLREHLESVRGD
jgi:hypothetical protein